jgi:hypothetical protein
MVLLAGKDGSMTSKPLRQRSSRFVCVDWKESSASCRSESGLRGRRRWKKIHAELLVVAKHCVYRNAFSPNRSRDPFIHRLRTQKLKLLLRVVATNYHLGIFDRFALPAGEYSDVSSDD